MVNDSTALTSSRRWNSRIGACAVGFVLVAGIFVYSTARFGSIEGEEFSPQSFRRRSFSYHELPVLGWQVTPISRTTTTGDLENYLVKQNLVPAVKNRPDRWDLAWASRGDARVIFGDAQILCRYLASADGQGRLVWLDWTKENPAKAAHFWPQVARLADQELYVLVPDLFNLARIAPNVDELRRRCTETLTRRCCELAELQYQLGNYQLAVELFGEAIAQSPDHLVALRGRASANQQLGNAELAAADLARTREIQNGDAPDPAANQP